MAKGHKTPGSGRKKGTPNKKIGKLKADLHRVVKVEGISPLECLLAVMSGSGEFTDKQIDAAKAAAPYVHAKKVEQQNTHVFSQFGERLDQMNRRDKDYTGK